MNRAIVKVYNGEAETNKSSVIFQSAIYSVVDSICSVLNKQLQFLTFEYMCLMYWVLIVLA